MIDVSINVNGDVELSNAMKSDPYQDVDWEREENLPPSAMLNLMAGLLIAICIVLFAGAGAIYNEVRGGTAFTGATTGAVIGVVVSLVYVVVHIAQLRGRGR